MALPPQPWEFRSKPAWQRLIIMLGGVTVNIIVGFVIYISIFYFVGQKIVTNDELPNGFAVSQTFKDLGFKDGDKVLKLNGKDFENLNDLNKFLFLRDVSDITVQHIDGATETLTIPEEVGMTMFKAGEMQPFQPVRSTVLDTVIPEMPAAKAGLKIGDKILSINGKKTPIWSNLSEEIKANPGKEITIEIERNGAQEILTVIPNEEGTIGINNFGREYVDAYKEVKYGFLESLSGGTAYGYNILKDYVSQFKYVFTSKGATQVGGFGAIANLFPSEWSWLAFWHTTALISIILAFMNILPIPALDGGHVVFLLYEMATGRKPNEKVMEYAQMAGFFLLIGLVLFANGNDIYRWLFK